MADDPNCRRNRVRREGDVAARLWQVAATTMVRQGLGEAWLAGYTGAPQEGGAGPARRRRR